MLSLFENALLELYDSFEMIVHFKDRYRKKFKICMITISLSANFSFYHLTQGMSEFQYGNMGFATASWGVAGGKTPEV